MLLSVLLQRSRVICSDLLLKDSVNVDECRAPALIFPIPFDQALILSEPSSPYNDLSYLEEKSISSSNTYDDSNYSSLESLLGQLDNNAEVIDNEDREDFPSLSSDEKDQEKQSLEKSKSGIRSSLRPKKLDCFDVGKQKAFCLRVSLEGEEAVQERLCMSDVIMKRSETIRDVIRNSTTINTYDIN